MSDARARILDSARRLFMQNGFAGTVVSKIAKDADVPHALIFHHFKNKAGLWMAVKEYITAKSADKHPIIPSTDIPLSEFLEKLIRNQIDFYQTHPDILQLVAWQQVESNVQIDENAPMSPLLQKWEESIAHYQEKGELRRDLTAKQLTFSIVCLCHACVVHGKPVLRHEHEIERLTKALPLLFQAEH